MWQIFCHIILACCLQEEITSQKIRELEEEKYELQQQLEKATEEVTNNPTLNHFKQLVEELKKQKLAADETCNRLEYDMTVLKMEKEKFATMLNVRDKEVKEIQEEMCKIQEQVHKQLKKLNSEVIERVNSVKALSGQSFYSCRFCYCVVLCRSNQWNARVSFLGNWGYNYFINYC